MHRDPGIWSEIHQVLLALGKDGMSSDETDQEGRAIHASTIRLRRIRLNWANEDISLLWRAVDSYYNPFKPTGAPKNGTKPMPRIYASVHTNQTREPPAGLPRNFYDNIYWASLPPVRQRRLNPAPAKALPKLVCHFHQPMCLALI
jgi:hypothetical protein